MVVLEILVDEYKIKVGLLSSYRNRANFPKGGPMSLDLQVVTYFKTWV